MQQENTKTQKKSPTRRAPVAPVTEDTSFSLDGVIETVRESITGFDKHPLQFVRENPMRATIFGFFIGLIFGSALSKRAVTK